MGQDLLDTVREAASILSEPGTPSDIVEVFPHLFDISEKSRYY
jgi:hypothetical protein